VKKALEEYPTIGRSEKPVNTPFGVGHDADDVAAIVGDCRSGPL
jgi:hypothetical protein